MFGSIGSTFGGLQPGCKSGSGLSVSSFVYLYYSLAFDGEHNLRNCESLVHVQVNATRHNIR